MDLFGLKKETEGGSVATAAPAPRGQHKLWAVLLVVDSIFVIIFGGAVAAKIYQHLKAPASSAAISGRNKSAAVAARESAKTPSASPQKADQHPPADNRTPSPAAKDPAPPAPAASGPKSAKPALLAEPPQNRQTPRPQTASAASEPARTPEPVARAKTGKLKAVPVEFKLKAPHAQNVQLAGAFIVRGGRKEMVPIGDDTWSLTLHLLPANTYRYWFIVDGRKTLDPDNSKSERGASALALP